LAALGTSSVLADLPVCGHVEGVIVMGEPIGDAIELFLLQRGLPVVVVDTQSKRFSAVAIDDRRGGHRAAAHLLGLGHRRIGYIIERQTGGHLSQGRRRLDGFADEVRAAGYELVLVECDGSLQAKRAALGQLLERSSTAVVAHCDDIALGALRGVLNSVSACPSTFP
jgi:DNA-binding LacI/PurR family transcriptional regulator